MRIDAAFDAASVEQILHRLQADSSPWAAQTQAALHKASPQSLRLALDLIQQGRRRTLRECLDAELIAGRYVVASADFVEGVRAALVDKDQAPVWTDSEYLGIGPNGEIVWDPRPNSPVAAVGDAHAVSGPTR